MTTVRKTIMIDKEVWEKFKRTTRERHGRKIILSKAVEEAISNYNTASLLRDAANALNAEMGVYPSSTEVEAYRPSAAGTSRLVREMRDAAAHQRS